MRTPISSCPPAKAALAQILSRTPWTRAVRHLEVRRPLARVFNYHGTPLRLRDGFERQVDRILERYEGASADRLSSLLQTGPGDHSVAIFSFDDGLQNHLDVAAPVLEARGLRGIFCIPAQFPSVPREKQPKWFLERVRPLRNTEHMEDSDLIGLDWDGVRELAARGHEVCCHSSSHERIGSDLPVEVLRREIVDSRVELEQRLGDVRIEGFCWPQYLDESARRAEDLVRSTYQWAFRDGCRPLRIGQDPYRIERTNVEASWPAEVVDLELSGITDARSRIRRAWRSVRRWMRVGDGG